MLAADDVRDLTLLKDFSNEVRHARCYENELDLGHGLLENLVQLSLADKLSIAILCLKQQTSFIILLHEPHARATIVEAMARNVEAGGLLPNNIDKFVLCCD